MTAAWVVGIVVILFLIKTLARELGGQHRRWASWNARMAEVLKEKEN